MADERSLERLKQGILSFHEETGRRPTQKSGDASSYVGYETTWGAVDQMLWRSGLPSLFQLCQELGLTKRFAPHSLDAIKDGIRAYQSRHYYFPSRGSGDATPYVGYRTTWGAVNQWLSKRGHGSLASLCGAMGDIPSAAPHDFESIEQGVRLYHEKKGRKPSRGSGDATPYVGYQTTWQAVHTWLVRSKEQTLAQLCQELGLSPAYAPHSLKKIEDGIRAFVKEHGKAPTVHLGDASKWLGYPATWNAVDQWLRKRDYGSLLELCSDLGCQTSRTPHNIEDIRDGVLMYIDEHRRAPRLPDNDASSYVGYPATWLAVSRWLQKEYYGSLADFCEELRCKINQ